MNQSIILVHSTSTGRAEVWGRTRRSRQPAQ